MKEEQKLSELKSVDQRQEQDDVEREELCMMLSDLLETAYRTGGDHNRIILQGDRGYLALSSSCGESEAELILAAGRSLTQSLTEEEAQKLYDQGFRRKSAAHPFVRTVNMGDQASREALVQEILNFAHPLYLSHWREGNIESRLGDRPELQSGRLVESMRKLSKLRDMSSRQKMYWSVIRTEVLLALNEAPPKSLAKERGRTQWVESGLTDVESISSSIRPRSFKDLTGYQSAAIFSDIESFEHIDPRGIYWVQIPGRLAISLTLAWGWDSLLINPHGKIGGELYRNELSSIVEGLKQQGW